MGISGGVVISMDIELEINYDNDTSYFDPSTKTIGLGYEFILLEKQFTPNEFNTCLSDTLTHEFLHGLLLSIFDNNTVSQLFDIVEHFFCNSNLKEKYVNSYNAHYHTDYMLWNNIIKCQGIQTFYNDYHLSNDKLNQAYILVRGGK